MKSKKVNRTKNRTKKYTSARSKRKDQRRRLTKAKRGGDFSDVKSTMELNLRDKPNKLIDVLKSVCKNPDNSVITERFSNNILTILETCHM